MSSEKDGKNDKWERKKIILATITRAPQSIRPKWNQDHQPINQYFPLK